MATRHPFARLAERPATITPLRAVVVAFLALWWGTALLSGYRAIVQIRDLRLAVSDTRLRPGTTLQARIATSGRAPAHLTVELIQGTRRDTLAVRRVPGNRDGGMDPRSQRGTIRLTLTPELLARFQPGPARLRATGLGTSQFLRVPPPTIREIAVWIPPERATR